MAADKEVKQSQMKGTDLWLLIMFGSILNVFVQIYMKDHRLMTDDLGYRGLSHIGIIVSNCAGYGFMGLVRSGLKKCAWFRKLEYNTRIQRVLTVAFFGLCAIGFVMGLCWRV